MTDEDFLARLRLDWRGQAVRPDEIAGRFARHRRWVRLSMIGGIVGAAGIAVGLIVFAGMALDRRDALFAIAALAFAVALPSVLIDISRLRSHLRVRYEETPLGLVLQTRARVSEMHRMLQGARWCAGILFAVAVTAWLPVGVGYASIRTVLPLSSVWGATALLVWLYQSVRGRRLADEAARMDHLVAEFEAANGTSDD